MKKFVRFFSGVISGFMCAVIAMPTTEAMWSSTRCRLQSPAPLEDQLEGPFRRALESGEAAATYCFFYPHASRYGIEMPMEYPTGKSFENIPVAICLRNEKAKEVFRNYFLAKEDPTFAAVLKSGEPREDVVLPVDPRKNVYVPVDQCESVFVSVDPRENVVKPVDPRENVFVISLADLNNMAYPDSAPGSVPKIALFTRNGILGDSIYRDYAWSWEEVIEKSTLRAEWNRAMAAEEPELRLRVKIRIMMKGLSWYAVGETTRALHSGKTTEMHFWRKFWTGRDVFVEE